jgi:toxin ParE1/3/4
MAKRTRKVVLSGQVEKDLSGIYDYGLITFGENFSEIFLRNIYQHIYELLLLFLVYPECKRLETKTQIYRNIILGKYLIIYRIRMEKIEAPRALHGSQSPEIIKTIKKIKIK